MNTGLWNMDSGLAAARRPGMTMFYAEPLPGGCRATPIISCEGPC
jgi:hypothetical protein